LLSASLPETPRTFRSERFVPDSYLVVHPHESVATTTSNPHMVERERRQEAQTAVHQTETEAGEGAETKEGAMAAAQGAGMLGDNNFDFSGIAAAAERFRYSEEETDALGDLRPSEVNEKTGAWGYGLRKIGPGSGDGKDWGGVKSKYKMASRKQRGGDYVKKALSRPHVASSPSPSGSTPAWLDELSGSGLSYDVIRGQLGLRRRRLGRCYDEEQVELDRPSVVHVRFAISPAGRVSGVAALSASSDHARSCIEEIVRSIEFPERSDGKTIHLAKFPVPV
jgi:hypothetical protein